MRSLWRTVVRSRADLVQTVLAFLEAVLAEARVRTSVCATGAVVGRGPAGGSMLCSIAGGSMNFSRENWVGGGGSRRSRTLLSWSEVVSIGLRILQTIGLLL